MSTLVYVEVLMDKRRKWPGQTLDEAIDAWVAAHPKVRFTFTVSVDRDGVPGWGNEPEDFRKHIQSVLDQTIGHYNPKVEEVAHG